MTLKGWAVYYINNINMIKKADDVFSEFELNLYEAAVRASPNNVEALRALGYLYTIRENHSKALEIDKKLCHLKPEDAVIHYNMACSCSNLGKIKESLDALELAILLGYSDVEHMQKDPDLNNIRNEPRYQEFLSKLKQNRNRLT